MGERGKSLSDYSQGMEVDWREDFLEGEKKDGRCMSGAEA